MAPHTKRAVSAEQSELLRQIPSVDELLAQPRLAQLTKRVDRNLVVEVARTVLDDLRGRIIGQTATAILAEISPVACDRSALEERITTLVERILARSLLPVINATGVILHTNLGRAPLPESAVEEFRWAATQYSNLEYDLEAGARGKRDVHTAELLTRLTGGEAAIVVNNCAAAVLVTLAALARGGEVIVSRGELIEIGDGFRIPEIMEQSGAVLREVGTTNRTRLSDYENAINEKTRLLLRVHKLAIAALEATLGAYLRAAWDEIPVMRMIRMTPEELKRRAENFIRELRPELPLDEVEIEVVDGASLAGGGSTPTQSLPSKVIRIASVRYSAAKLEQRLRRAPAGTSVIARVEDDRLALDLRTVFPEQEPLLVKTLAAALH